jgi:voltage-gated potassium channel
MVTPRDLPHLGPLRLPEGSPVLALLPRIGLAVALILIVIVTVVLWWDRDGLRDTAHPDQPMTFVGVFYFTVVSLTTVGYGDIVPVVKLLYGAGANLVVTPSVSGGGWWPRW